MITMIAGLALVTVVAFGAFRWARHGMKRLSYYEGFSDSFFENAKALTADAETPAAVIAVLAFLNEKLTDKAAARQAFLSITYRSAPIPGELIEEEEELNEFLQRRPELSRAFGRACVSAMLAISYRSGLWGHLLRNLVLFDLTEVPERSPKLVERYRLRAYANERHDALSCPAPA